MSWFKVNKAPKGEKTEKKVAMPEGLWIKCNNCGEIIYKKEVQRNLNVCPKCNYHFRISAQERIDFLADKGTFVEYDAGMEAADPLNFKDSKRYKDRVKDAQKSSGLKDAFISGEAVMKGISVMLGVFDFSFMGGSMGSVVGEKATRTIEKGIKKGFPVIIVSSSGGARMQEGILSLMQMAKTSAALARLRDAGLPFISILTDPTTGGVTASFAMLGDVNIAEPKALICFAGPRVIEQTIKQKLPEGFQRSEYLLDHGMVDMIVERKDMKDTIGNILSMLTSAKSESLKD
ncbi:MAG: acetyl-CoA carboxylase, carboxyltransferase subunit beta [Deltaproteobacteria bacterium]|nr:acetyl-CoA carboxylase, carboxyltransferase subunit beta [Deltaproteobacteria bacterium]